MRSNLDKALLIVDLQCDFMPGGALGVKGGDEVVPLINQLIKKFSLVIATQDWHVEDHVSFAAVHGKKTGEVIEINGHQQELWPVHCVEHTSGAHIVKELDRAGIHKYIYKGTDRMIDSYSAFFDNDGVKSTGLNDFLKAKEVRKLYIAGLTTDFCVLYSVLDARKLGYQVAVIQDACRPIYDEKRAFQKMEEAGAELITSSDL